MIIVDGIHGVIPAMVIHGLFVEIMMVVNMISPRMICVAVAVEGWIGWLLLRIGMARLWELISPLVI